MGHRNVVFLGSDIGRLREFEAEWYSDSPYVRAYTSGSTGQPKLIQLHKSDMLMSAQATNRYFGIDAASFLLCPLSFDYIAAKMMFVRAVAADCKLVCIDPSNRLSLPDSMVYSLISVVPSQIPALVEQKCKFQRLLIGGGAIPVDLEIQLQRSGVAAFHSYGMTETCSHVALRQVGQPEVFGALPGVGFSVDKRNCLVIDLEGRINNRFVTNDVVELIDERHFRWLGRADNVINSGGVKLQAEEIERLLAPLLSGSNYYVRACKDDKWGQRPQLVVEGHIDADALMLEMARLIPTVYRPESVLTVDKIELTRTGKIIRK